MRRKLPLCALQDSMSCNRQEGLFLQRWLLQGFGKYGSDYLFERSVFDKLEFTEHKSLCDEEGLPTPEMPLKQP